MPCLKGKALLSTGRAMHPKDNSAETVSEEVLSQ